MLRFQHFPDGVIADPEGLFGAAQVIGRNAVFLPQHVGVDAGIGQAGAHRQHVDGVFRLTVQVHHGADAVIMLGGQHVIGIGQKEHRNAGKADQPQPEKRNLLSAGCRLLRFHRCSSSP